MFLKKTTSLIKIMFRFKVSRYKNFKLDSILLSTSNIVFLLGTILFWYLINDAGFIVDSWSYSEILVFIGLSEMFYGFEQNVFSVASLFWNVVYTGSLDTQLVRPIDPRIRFMLLNINYSGLLTAFIKMAVIFVYSGAQLNILRLVFSIIIILLANVVLTLIRLIICYISFWGGKMDSLTQICDSFTTFNKYPLIIFPNFIKVIFQTIVPFYFFSTFPAEFLLGKLNYHNMLIIILGLIINIIIWTVLNNLAWKKGRERYESISG